MTNSEANTGGAGSYLQANGLNIYFEEYGSGEPLLLIHGGIENLSAWAQHIPIFAKYFRVIAPDSRGHGRTRNPADTLSYRLLADDMAAFVRALGLNRPLVCGYSDGGQVELEMGMNYPGLAKAYVVAGAAYRWLDIRLEYWRDLGVEHPGVVDDARLELKRPGMVKYMREQHDIYQGEDYWRTLMRHTSMMWLEPLDYSSADFRKITEPTLVLVGDRDDRLIPMEDAVHMYRSIPGAESAVVPGSDHGAAFNKADLFTSLSLDFLLRNRADTKQV